MNFLPENMFIVESTYTYYEWRKVFDEFLDIELLLDDIVDALSQNFFKGIWDQLLKVKTYEYFYNGMNYRVSEIIKRFRQDCNKMGFELIGDYKMFIPSVEYQKY